MEGAIVGAPTETLNEVGNLVKIVGVFVIMLNDEPVGTRVGNALGLTGTGALENTPQDKPESGSIVGGPATAVGVKVERTDGRGVGALVGVTVGTLVGSLVGTLVGFLLGTTVGRTVGRVLVGILVVGPIVNAIVGILVGLALGM